MIYESAYTNGSGKYIVDRDACEMLDRKLRDASEEGNSRGGALAFRIEKILQA